MDQLPSLQSDPFIAEAQRASRHCAERLRLDCFADSLKLQVHLPETSTGFPGGPFSGPKKPPKPSGIATGVSVDGKSLQLIVPVVKLAVVKTPFPQSLTDLTLQK